MKIFKFMIVALVAMCGFASCSDDCDHDFIEYDHSADLVGTWTCLQEGLAEALVIKADGSVVSTGVLDGEYWDGVKGSIKTVNNKMTFTFEGGDNYETRFDIIPGVAFSIFNEEGERLTYNYCANDLADEVVGMWVCNDYSTGVENDMVIHTFKEDGTVTKTGWSAASNKFIVNETITYKVVGDLVFHQRPSNMVAEGAAAHFASKLTYMPNANQLGDMLTNTSIKVINGEAVELSASMLRVKQSLNLANKSYDYSDVYVTNVKGLDKDIPFHPEYTFNFAKMDGTLIDQILKSILFGIEFPDANTFKYSCSYPNPNTSMEAPMVVDGNKVTVKMSERNPAYRDIDFYMFQDADDSQLHMYLPTNSFINFYGNMQIIMMEQLGQIDTTDATAVKAVYDSLDEAVETINMSFVLKARN